MNTVNPVEQSIQQPNTRLSALILGASGATGRELVQELSNSEKWHEIYVIVRRALPGWEKMPKLKILIVETLDELQDSAKWKFPSVDTLFCCLGGRTKEGEAQFTKVDLTYPKCGAKIALENNIPHYSLLTSKGSDKKSMFLYMRVKGQCEEAISQGGFRMTSIHRPGLIKDRNNDARCGECLMKYLCCCFASITASQLARAMRIEAEYVKTNLPQKSMTSIYENSQILEFARRQ